MKYVSDLQGSLLQYQPAWQLSVIPSFVITRSPNGQLAALPSTKLPIIIAPNYYSYPPPPKTWAYVVNSDVIANMY